MTSKALKEPSDKKKGLGGWEQIKDLYDQILKLFYEENDRARALVLKGRLHRLLSKHASEHDSIFGEECWSVLHELRNDLPAAITHREREIELILKLWEVSANTPGMSVALKKYGVSDLADRYDLLAILYHDAGDLDRAIVTLMRSKWLCESLKVPFDGDDLLQDYLYEKNINSSLMRALEKQGWRLRDTQHDPSPKRGDPPRRSRLARPRRRGGAT